MSMHPSDDEIGAWWDRWPDANIGIVTGTVSGVAVLDIDPRNGGDAARRRLEATHDLLPVCPEVASGGGGTHLWFRCTTATPSGVVTPGIDLKAEGGLIVAPPSRHISGLPYRWRPAGGPADVALPDLPDWVPPLVTDTGSRNPATPRTTAEQAEFRDAWSRAGIDLLTGDRYYRCPFHDDHRPSLHIDADGCRWYCFGCATGGGIGRLRQLLGEHPEPIARARLTHGEEPEPRVTLDGSQEVEVVGESLHQDELLQLTGGSRRYGGVDVRTVAELRPDPDNPVDPAAIEVRIADRTVGYIRGHDLGWVRPQVEASIEQHGHATCKAAIRGGWDRGHGDVGWFGVVLLLPD
jgi:hypothetical protein